MKSDDGLFYRENSTIPNHDVNITKFIAALNANEDGEQVDYFDEVEQKYYNGKLYLFDITQKAINLKNISTSDIKVFSLLFDSDWVLRYCYRNGE